MSTAQDKTGNKLIKETSPYLLQHAHNPVDWYPWGEEALEKARQEDKPIILSIGYSSCHWCHVMEKECFEDEEVAQLMNNNFINIKLDREERPDVDQIYIEAVQSMGSQAGWPLNVFLTPEQKPFYGGTYFPKPHWMQLLKNVTEVFKNKRQDLEKSAEAFKQNLSKSDTVKFGLSGQGKLDQIGDINSVLNEIYQTTKERFDPEWGGNASAPKFPMPSNWLFLLRYYHISQNEEVINQIKLTLDLMAAGGIYDQIGGGFARYSVDEKWFVPHFEKMLYDNGQLLRLFAEAYRLTRKDVYHTVIKETAKFLEREMMSKEGGFYTALDADSEGVEGKFYIWTEEEIDNTLGENADLIKDFYNIKSEGNWENGQNILYRSSTKENIAQKYGLDINTVEHQIENAKSKLLDARSHRIRPEMDDKILSGWNGLALQGLTEAFAATSNDYYFELARKNAEFLEKNMIYKNEGGETALWRKYKNGKAEIAAYLEDYAFVIEAFTAFYQISFDEKWIRYARKLTDYTLAHFYDEHEDFFFYTDDATTRLISRKKELFDNVIPASNSAMAHNLYTLGLILDNREYQNRAENMTAKMVKLIKKEPVFLSNWARLLTTFAKSPAEIAIVGPEAQNFARKLLQHYYPNKVLTGTNDRSELPLLKERKPENGKTTIFVCYDKTCQLPVNTVEDALEQLA